MLDGHFKYDTGRLTGDVDFYCASRLTLAHLISPLLIATRLVDMHLACQLSLFEGKCDTVCACW